MTIARPPTTVAAMPLSAFSSAVNLANGSTNLLDTVGLAYCSLCNFASYVSSIMGDSKQRMAHIKDATDFFAEVSNGTLPAVSFVKPDGLVDGHAATSKVDLFERMLQNILETLNANPELKAKTALFITFDEGGGYYDSGFIQPLDFFGDGPRIPLVVVSPYSTGGHVVHSYIDHVSILKFIERNGHLAPLTSRSRDNLPNPRRTNAIPMCRSTRRRSATYSICSISITGMTTAKRSGSKPSQPTPREDREALRGPSVPSAVKSSPTTL
jgi:phospholipase C